METLFPINIGINFVLNVFHTLRKFYAKQSSTSEILKDLFPAYYLKKHTFIGYIGTHENITYTWMLNVECDIVIVDNPKIINVSNSGNSVNEENVTT